MFLMYIFLNVNVIHFFGIVAIVKNNRSVEWQLPVKHQRSM